MSGYVGVSVWVRCGELLSWVYDGLSWVMLMDVLVMWIDV